MNNSKRKLLNDGRVRNNHGIFIPNKRTLLMFRHGLRVSELCSYALSSLTVCFVLLATPLRAQFVYVANFSGGVSAYSISSNGALIPVPGSPFPAGSEPFSVAVHPTGKFAYVANSGDNTISAYSIGSNGALTPVPGSPFAVNPKGFPVPVSVAVDPTGQFAYVANANDSTVSGYSIGSNGGLTPIPGSPFVLLQGHTPVSIAVDPTSNLVFVYVANQQSNTVDCFTIGSNGALIPVAAGPFFGYPDIGRLPNSVAVDAIGQFLYVVSEEDSTVSAFSIDPALGTGDDVPGSPFYDAGGIPVSVTVDPTGRFVYVANSGSIAGVPGNVSAYSIGSSGALTPVPGSPFAAGVDPLSVAVDPTGRFVYAANFVDNTVSAYSIGSNGALTLVPGSAFLAGVHPCSVGISPLVPFASSFAKLEIKPRRFELNESFTLGKNSNGINPVTENVSLQIGNFSATIPPGSFKQKPDRRFAFEGVINSVSLEIHIVPLGNNIFTFKAEGKGVDLTGLTNPVTVVLTIGIDSGTTNAEFQKSKGESD